MRLCIAHDAPPAEVNLYRSLRAFPKVCSLHVGRSVVPLLQKAIFVGTSVLFVNYVYYR